MRALLVQLRTRLGLSSLVLSFSLATAQTLLAQTQYPQSELAPSRSSGVVSGTAERSIAKAANLAPHPFGMTMLVHGGTVGADPVHGWMDDMASAMKSRGGGAIPVITLTVTAPFGVAAPISIAADQVLQINATNASAIIIVDWTDLSTIVCYDPNGERTGRVAAALFAFIRTTFPSTLKLPWHLIGHSRGASVVNALASAFSTIGAWTDQATFLDPHPESVLPCSDFPMEVPHGTHFADNYYETQTIPSGQSVIGTAETSLTGILPLVASAHELVHTYYHGTIDTSATQIDGRVIDPSWYNDTNRDRWDTGFGYSRIAWSQAWRGVFPSEGVSAYTPAGTGARYCWTASAHASWGLPAVDTCTLPVSVANIPNVSITSTFNYHNVVVGESAPLFIATQHRTAYYSLRLDLDDDRNPFNGNASGTCSGAVYTQVGYPNAPSQINAISHSLSWVPANQNVGTCYIRATVTDVNGNVRYDYTERPLRVISASQGLSVPPNRPAGFTRGPKVLQVPGASFLRISVSGTLAFGDRLTIRDGPGNTHLSIDDVDGDSLYGVNPYRDVEYSFVVPGDTALVAYTGGFSAGTPEGIVVWVDAASVLDRSLFINSNYVEPFVQDVYLGIAGASKLLVTVSSRLQDCLSCDFIEIISDLTGVSLLKVTGTSDTTFLADGSRIRARFVSDSSVQGTDWSYVSVSQAQTDPPRLANISTRGQVQTGFDVMIGGFVISGSSPKTVVVRAIGPSLANFGVAGVLPNPQLQLVRSSDQTTIATNDNWGDAANSGLLQASGFAPSNPLESAIYATLQPGAYTAIVSGVAGAIGVGLIEVYEVDHPEVALINISTRGKVQTGFDVMIGGFVILGSGSQTVVIRAVGPSLANYGVAGALANPQVQLVRSSDQVVIASNDDWASAPNAFDIQASGFAPANPLESAMLVTLQPGAYTAIVSGVGGGTGVGLVEVYKVQ